MQDKQPDNSVELNNCATALFKSKNVGASVSPAITHPQAPLARTGSAGGRNCALYTHLAPRLGNSYHKGSPWMAFWVSGGSGSCLEPVCLTVYQTKHCGPRTQCRRTFCTQSGVFASLCGAGGGGGNVGQEDRKRSLSAFSLTLSLSSRKALLRIQKSPLPVPLLQNSCVDPAPWYRWCKLFVTSNCL